MADFWTIFKRFPDPQSGKAIEAPRGPGVYEIRHIPTGELVAFGHTANVVLTLASLPPKPVSLFWLMSFIRYDIGYALNELEYRTCSTKTLQEAKMITTHLMERRETYLRRRAASGLV